MESSSQNTKALKAGGWYIICNFIVKGLSVLTTPVFTRLLSSEDYGIVATYSSYTSLFAIIATLDLYSCVQISKQDWDTDNNQFVCSVLTLSSISTVAFFGILLAICSFFPDILGIPVVLVKIMFLEVIFSNAFTLIQTQHRAYLRYKQVVFLTLFQAIAGTILSVFFVLGMKENRYEGRIAGMALAIMVVGVYVSYTIIKKGKYTWYKKEYWKYAINISLPLVPHHLSGNVLSNFDRIMITSFCDVGYTGIYNLGYSCGAMLQLLWSSFNGAWVPWFYDAMKEEKYEDIKRAVKPYLLLFSVFVLGIVAIAPELIKILGPEMYWTAKWVVPPVALGLFCQFLYSLYVNIEFYYKKTKMIATMTIVSAVLNIILNFVFIQLFGYLAAAYTTLTSYIFLFAAHYIMADRLMGKDIYSKKFVFATIISVSVMTFILMLFYSHFFVRIFIALFGIMCVGIIEKNDIIWIFGSIIKKEKNVRT